MSCPNTVLDFYVQQFQTGRSREGERKTNVCGTGSDYLVLTCTSTSTSGTGKTRSSSSTVVVELVVIQSVIGTDQGKYQNCKCNYKITPQYERVIL